MIEAEKFLVAIEVENAHSNDTVLEILDRACRSIIALRRQIPQVEALLGAPVVEGAMPCQP